jgi:hypothetical protein
MHKGLKGEEALARKFTVAAMSKDARCYSGLASAFNGDDKNTSISAKEGFALTPLNKSCVLAPI